MGQIKSTETEIIMTLKREGPLTLQQLSQKLGITKMGVYKHLAKLERQGVVSRKIVKKEVGRPSYIFSLSDKGREYFVSSDSIVLLSLLEFLQREDKGSLVIKFLKERSKIKMEEYEEKLNKMSFDEKVEKLCNLRNEEGYMAEIKKSGNCYELLEYNCPIFKVASLFGEACSLEQKLFSAVLKTQVENTHRQVNGYNICRFLIRGKNAPHQIETSPFKIRRALNEENNIRH
ncbi:MULTISPECIES: metalloregulator ArsR/SmtB family transcription factor [Acidianus]|uniref:Transcriptional regulator n=1 Tax=Candidatus Acidianus copahuensis TaxID=1160895 RepID=A0A031LQQ8_9CREN|nr:MULTISPECIES: metalloregulator ArsR/SmtB family transcription factor [Acidianus]EZQ10136.1 transcriptional regulator [Candidatus Acidianus copahuensis]NON62989.1 transcriptional regulator [Acidianus sp. RZ1]